MSDITNTQIQINTPEKPLTSESDEEGGNVTNLVSYHCVADECAKTRGKQFK